MTQAKSHRELIASGTYRPGRHASRVDDQFPSDAPAPPDDLIGDDLELWQQVVGTFPRGTLAATDWPLLLMFVRWFRAWRELDRRLGENPTDYKVATMCGMASKQAMAAAAKLGMSPVDRRKLTAAIAEDKEADELLAFLAARP